MDKIKKWFTEQLKTKTFWAAASFIVMTGLQKAGLTSGPILEFVREALAGLALIFIAARITANTTMTQENTDITKETLQAALDTKDMAETAKTTAVEDKQEIKEEIGANKP